MNIERTFSSMAIRQSDTAEARLGAKDLAQFRLQGSIGQLATSRLDYLMAGLQYIKDFPQLCRNEIELIQCNEVAYAEDANTLEDARNLVDEIRALESQVGDVDLAAYVQLLDDDWIENIEEEDE